MSKLIITLKSDLCAASGDGFSSVIDTDVSYDRFGFPLIGARRLKGCLRDAAILIGTEPKQIHEIFGEPGRSERGSLRIADAHLQNYDELLKEKGNLSAAEISSLFTYTRSATAIENDTAKDNTLRFTRVVKHYSPLTGTETVFEADIELDEQYHQTFAEICKALRNVGYKRNRGYGAVQCVFKPSGTAGNTVSVPETVSDAESAFSYTVRLLDDLMLPGSTSSETLDFIPGTSVLGYFANQYLKSHPADELFEETFLKQNLRFSNLYISDENGTEFMPAPSVLGKIKGESDVLNAVIYPNSEQKIIKPVKHGYCDTSCRIRLPLTETVYHHATEKPSQNQTLYTQTALSGAQYFRGTISGRKEYVSALYQFLCDAKEKGMKLYFGRSKTAQYSGCEVFDIEDMTDTQNDTETVRAGEVFIAHLLSDVILPDKLGGLDLTAEGLQCALGSEFAGLKPDAGVTKPNGQPLYCSALRYRVISGYNAKWNLKKPHIRTIAAGSTLVFKAEQTITLPKRRYIGDKQNEGFGAVMFCRADAFVPQEEQQTDTLPENTGMLTEYLEKNRKTEEMRSTAISFVSKLSPKFRKINSAQIGRYIMMVKQADDLNALKSLTEPGKNHNNPKASMQDFRNLYLDAFRDLPGHQEDDRWREYLLLILTLMKYEKRGR